MPQPDPHIFIVHHSPSTKDCCEAIGIGHSHIERQYAPEEKRAINYHRMSQIANHNWFKDRTNHPFFGGHALSFFRVITTGTMNHLSPKVTRKNYFSKMPDGRKSR
jgi:hypothetical protein